MTDAQTRLTHIEYTAALVDAGIDTDESLWDDATLERAYVVVDEAQKAKLARLNPRHKTPEPAEYTLADMASDFDKYLGG